MQTIQRAMRQYVIALLGAILYLPVSSAAPTDAAAAHAAAGLAERRLKPPKLPRDAEDQPGAAERFFLSKRLAPGMAEYPMERLLRAQVDAARLPLYSTAANGFVAAPEGSLAAQSLTWTSLGPGNVGGRTRAFRFAPGSSTTIYAGGVAGGVWKTTNAGTSWTALGDAMANMAVTSILVDPSNSNVLYAGTGEGFFNFDGVRGAGIFKSTDGGTTWTQLSATNTSNFNYVNDLAFKPDNSAIIYAATRTGLFRSTNSGSSWTQLINAANSLGCMKVVYRSDVDTAIAGCGTFNPTASSNGIWRSTNASAASPTWTHVVGPTGSGATQILANMGRTSLAIAPSSQGTVYALIACSPSAANQCGSSNAFEDGLLAVYKSTDGGATWSAAYSSTFNGGVLADLLLTNPEAQLCEGLSGFNQGWYDNTIAVDPTNANRVFASGIEAFRSDDGGTTWGTIAYWWLSGNSHYAHADHHGIVFHPNYNGIGEKRIYDVSDGGIFVSTDAATATKATSATNVCPDFTSQLLGGTWASLNNGYGVTQFYHGTVYPSGTQYFAGAQDNGTQRGADGSPNGWTSIHGGDGGWTAIDKNTSGSGTVLYAEFTGISIQKSTNNGSSFSDAISGIANTGCGLFINPFQMDPNSTQRLFTSSNVLWRTSNAASTWAQASAAISGSSCTSTDNGERFSNYAIAPGNSNLLIAGTNLGHICRLTNAASSTSSSTLQNCTQPAGAGTYVSAIAFDPNSATTAYATISTFGATHVWKSTNSGQTWTSIAGSGANALPDSPAHTVAVSPFDSNTIYVGTEIGVFVTSDGGTNWARENTGFANVITDHLVFSPTGATGQTLYAFTHGRGVFRAPVSGGPVASTTTLAATPDPSLSGQSVTLTATVTGTQATPTGTVNFLDGANALASNVALNGSGIATFATTTLSVGSHTLSASYSGSATYRASSDSEAQTVNKASTATTIGSDTPDPSVVGQTVAVGVSVAIVAPGAGTPSGTVTVTGTHSNGNCTITLPATSCNLTFIAAGSQTINATYNGDANFSSSSAGSVSHTVNKAGTTLSIADSPDPSLVGANVTITRTLNVTAPGAGTPTGTISITGTDTSGCTITLPATTCQLTFSSDGAQTLDASYSGDANFAASTATQIAHTVTPTVDLSISKTDNATTAVSAGAVTYTIIVTNAGPSTATSATLSDAAPGLSAVSWTCTPTPPAACPHASGSGAIGEILTLAAGRTLTYQLTGTVTGASGGTLTNTAQIAAAGGTTDVDPADNSATDVDAIISDEIFGNGFEP